MGLEHVAELFPPPPLLAASAGPEPVKVGVPVPVEVIRDVTRLKVDCPAASVGASPTTRSAPLLPASCPPTRQRSPTSSAATPTASASWSRPHRGGGSSLPFPGRPLPRPRTSSSPSMKPKESGSPRVSFGPSLMSSFSGEPVGNQPTRCPTAKHKTRSLQDSFAPRAGKRSWLGAARWAHSRCFRYGRLCGSRANSACLCQRVSTLLISADERIPAADDGQVLTLGGARRSSWSSPEKRTPGREPAATPRRPVGRPPKPPRPAGQPAPAREGWSAGRRRPRRSRHDPG